MPNPFVEFDDPYYNNHDPDVNVDIDKECDQTTPTLKKRKVPETFLGILALSMVVRTLIAHVETYPEATSQAPTSITPVNHKSDPYHLV